MATSGKKAKDTRAPQSATGGRKRVKVKDGQLVAVPLLDGTFALLHVARFDGDIVGAHFAHRAKTPEQLLEGLEGAMAKKLIAIAEVTPNDVKDGSWPVIGFRPPEYPDTMLDMKGRSYTSNFSECLLNAYYGLRPWDEMKDPYSYKSTLLPGVPVPPTVRYERDFAKDAAASAAQASTAEAEPPVTEGPAEIHIEIKYPGNALPSIDLLHRRQALEDALEASGAGEVTDAGGGGGVMDVYLETKDVRRALPLVEAAVRAHGFAADARIETSAPDDAPESS
jgi:hypothetical protein